MLHPNFDVKCMGILLEKSKMETKSVRRFLMAYLDSYRRRVRPSSNAQTPLGSSCDDSGAPTTWNHYCIEAVGAP